MDTGDKLALGAVAALAAIGMAKQRRQGSRNTEEIMRMVYRAQGKSEDWIDRKLGITSAPKPAPKTTTRKTTTRKTTTRKTTTRKQPAVTTRQQPAVTARQQTMISQILKKMGKLTAAEKRTYTAKLSALTEDQVQQLKTQCDQEAA